MIDDMLEEEDIRRKTDKYIGQATHSAIVNKQMREYEKEIIRKLPNELRSALKGYNHRNDNNAGFFIDLNNYGYY